MTTAIENGDRDRKGVAYGRLRNAYQSMGDYRKATEYHEKRLKITMESGDRDGEGGAYGSLGKLIAYESIGDYRKAIEYHEKCLKIAMESGDRDGEGGAYGSLSNAYQSMGDYRKAIEYHEKRLKLQWKVVIGTEKEEPMEVSVMLTRQWVTIEKSLSIMKNI